MIRLANVREFGMLRRGVAAHYAPRRQHFSGAAAAAGGGGGGLGGGDGHRGGGPAAAAAAAAAVRGLPYSRLTVGVPMERYPLERRVAATPEVRAEAGVLP